MCCLSAVLQCEWNQADSKELHCAECVPLPKAPARCAQFSRAAYRAVSHSTAQLPTFRNASVLCASAHVVPNPQIVSLQAVSLQIVSPYPLLPNLLLLYPLNEHQIGIKLINGAADHAHTLDLLTKPHPATHSHQTTILPSSRIARQVLPHIACQPANQPTCLPACQMKIPFALAAACLLGRVAAQQWCLNALTQCNNDFSTCQTDLGTCQASLNTCTPSLNTCQTDLANCRTANTNSARDARCWYCAYYMVKRCVDATVGVPNEWQICYENGLRHRDGCLQDPNMSCEAHI